MTRRLKRFKDCELSLTIKDDSFIRPPRAAQRNWLLNRALKEFGEDLYGLHEIAGRFVPGAEPVNFGDRTQAELGEQDLMEDWQIPVMRAMAEVAGKASGEVLEIGFGRGVSSTFLQEWNPRSHTIVECNDKVVESFHQWRADYPNSDIRLLHGRWQDQISQFGEYDAIFFHTYPLTEDEYVELALKSATFAGHFFETAAAHLREGGVFTYLSNEIDSLSRAHQRLLLNSFRSFEIRLVHLDMPSDVRDSWWADSMVIVAATK